jgi:hypothetical protein
VICQERKNKKKKHIIWHPHFICFFAVQILTFTAMAATPTYQPTVSPVDALWALYQSQSKKVRKAFRQKLQEEEKARAVKEQQEMVKESMTRAFEELRSGKARHNAKGLFNSRNS